MTTRSVRKLLISLLILGGCAVPAGGPGSFEDVGAKGDQGAAGEDCSDCFPIDPGGKNVVNPDEAELEDVPAPPGLDVPPTFQLVAVQSPVKNQQRRGVCSIFSTVAHMEHLYLKALDGLDEERPLALQELIESGNGHPKFSEQFLQWSVKSELEGYPWPNAEGSSAAYNLETIAEHGIVPEQAWKYEGHKWTTSDLIAYYEAQGGYDEEEHGTCEDEPADTLCFTNGMPPEEVRDPLRTPRWRLPDAKYIWQTPENIKKHMVQEGTGVEVGLDFYYQAWNHGGARSAPEDFEADWCGDVDGNEDTPDVPCTLVTSDERRTKGIVLAPNEQDREFSRAKRAGHSILLVGWDDTMKVPRVDHEGETIYETNFEGEVLTDEEGNPVPVYDEGFFLFKNSWGTSAFGTDHGWSAFPDQIPAGYGWISYEYVRRFGRARIGAPPDLAVQPEACEDKIDNDLDGLVDEECGGGEPGSGERFEAVDTPLHFGEDPTTIESTIEVPADAGTVGQVAIHLDLKHTWIGDVSIMLRKGEREVSLDGLPRDDGDDFQGVLTSEAFAGEPAAGTWTLVLTDGYPTADDGSLEGWTLELIAAE